MVCSLRRFPTVLRWPRAPAPLSTASCVTVQSFFREKMKPGPSGVEIEEESPPDALEIVIEPPLVDQASMQRVYDELERLSELGGHWRLESFSWKRPETPRTPPPQFWEEYLNPSSPE